MNYRLTQKEVQTVGGLWNKSVRPIDNTRYADVIWGSVSNSKMESLQRFQDRSISIIDTARIKDDCSKNFIKVKQLIAFD